MTNVGFTKLRSYLGRGLAVVAVAGTFALGNIGTQVLSAVGVSTLAMAVTATPAQARRHRHWHRHWHHHWHWRRHWHRRW